MTTHENVVIEQFNSKSNAYLKSAVHAAGPDLHRAQALIEQYIPTKAKGQGIDIGCGAGHLSFALAPHLKRMVAYDPAPTMLDTVTQAALEKGISNIEVKQGGAEALPYPDATFCFATTRYSAHHWENLSLAVHEMKRVVKPGGYVLIIDVETSQNPLVDTWFQTIELLRDKSHVRNRSGDEWLRYFGNAGITLLEYSHWQVRLDFALWAERMKTPKPKVEMIRILQQEAPSEVLEALAIEEDGSFSIRTGLWFGRV
jgi:ubiquinone/menaquinone biosynthesis C-methylase UbiE